MTTTTDACESARKAAVSAGWSILLQSIESMGAEVSAGHCAGCVDAAQRIMDGALATFCHECGFAWMHEDVADLLEDLGKKP